MHFHLHVRYEIGTHLLTSLKKNKATRISNNIHEWRRHHHLIKFYIPDQLLIEWFTKTFANHIAKDITMGGTITEEQAIAHAQYLDLDYSESCTLYDIFSDALHPSSQSIASKYSVKPPADDVIGSISQTSWKSSSAFKKKMSYFSDLVPQNPPNPGKTS